MAFPLPLGFLAREVFPPCHRHIDVGRLDHAEGARLASRDGDCDHLRGSAQETSRRLAGAAAAARHAGGDLDEAVCTHRHHHQSASAVRPGTAWRARPRPRPLRALADQHVSRRVAGHGADRPGGSSTARSMARASAPTSNRSVTLQERIEALPEPLAENATATEARPRPMHRLSAGIAWRERRSTPGWQRERHATRGGQFLLPVGLMLR